jgi:hypothetical protein
MSVGDFGTMIQDMINPLITLTDVGTSVSGQADNGANHINATVYAFWFILGDAAVGFFYTDVILSGPGGSNIVFQLNWTDQWANGFKTPLRFYTNIPGYIEGVTNMLNYIYPVDGQGRLDFLANAWVNTTDKDAVTLVIFKANS